MNSPGSSVRRSRVPAKWRRPQAFGLSKLRKPALHLSDGVGRAVMTDKTQFNSEQPAGYVNRILKGVSRPPRRYNSTAAHAARVRRRGDRMSCHGRAAHRSETKKT